MTHQAIQEMIWRLHDAELPKADRDAVRVHLSGCLECSEIARRTGRLHHLLATAPQPAPSEAFVEAVMQRLPDAVPARQPFRLPQLIQPWRLLERLSLGVAAAGLLMAILIRQQPAIATEALLRSEWPSQEGWAFSDESPEADMLLEPAGDSL